MEVDDDAAGDDEQDDTKRALLNVPTEPTEEYSDDEEGDNSFEMKSTNLGQNSRRAYLKELRKVVESADVILHVLGNHNHNQNTNYTYTILIYNVSCTLYVLFRCPRSPRYTQ